MILLSPRHLILTNVHIYVIDVGVSEGINLLDMNRVILIT